MKNDFNQQINKIDACEKAPKVLVICALPITKSGSTRAYYTYLGKIPVCNVAQIYTNPAIPDNFDICENYYQITDKTVVRNFFHRKKRGGINWKNSINNDIPNKRPGVLYRVGKKDFSSIDLIRSFVWKKSNYLTDELKKFLNEFQPDLILYHNSNALFMEKVALAIKEYLNIPIVIDVSDDYYFDYYHSINPLTLLKRRIYRSRFSKLMGSSSNQIFVSQKMADKYNSYFKTNGVPIYISSLTTQTKTISKSQYLRFGYFGNLGLGRDKELVWFIKLLKKSGFLFSFDLFTPRLGNTPSIKQIKSLCSVRGFCEYDKMIQKFSDYDFLVFLESSKRRQIKRTKYCLSTKVSDYLNSGTPIIAIGSFESGSIQFLAENKCALMVSHKKIDLSMFDNKTKIQNILTNAKKTCAAFFNFERNSSECFKILFESIKNESLSN